MSGLTLIGDGPSGRTAGVDHRNRLKTSAVVEDEATFASLNGDTFNLTTGTVNLTSDNESWLLYGKNEDLDIWVVESIVLAFGASDGVGDFFQTTKVNPTAGTLVDSGSALGTSFNLNLGSSKVLLGTVLVGQEGSTLTDGNQPRNILMTEFPDVRILETGPIVIPPGTSFALGIIPPTGNTGMNVAINVTIYRQNGN